MTVTLAVQINDLNDALSIVIIISPGIILLSINSKLQKFF